MKQIILICLFVLLTICSNAAKKNIDKILKNISQIDSLKLIGETDYGSNIYELWFRQPVNHNYKLEEYFPQRVIFEFRNYDAPVVVVIEGYSIHTMLPSEPASLFNANQLTIEHRFFNQSRPVDSIPWKSLNIYNAAADHHQIIQAFKPYFKGKWISTGISKGGQATIFHRSLYPDDVDVSIPYVAPLNFSDKDERIFLFLDTVSTPECRERIYEFQKELLVRKKELMPLFMKEIETYKWTFPISIDSVYDLSVFEFSFSYWQWGDGNCATIPAKNASDHELYEYFSKSGAIGFFTDKSIEFNRPFFYQALTEIGMYGYDTKPFAHLTNMSGIVGFEYTLPEGYKHVIYNPEPMLKVDQWIKEHGNNMMYIYGGTDAWSAMAVSVGEKTNSVSMFNPHGNHGTRIKSFPEKTRNEILSILEKWLSLKISPTNN